MDGLSFAAGITLQDNRILNGDVTAIDEGGITYTSEEGTGRVPWSQVKAVMLATTDHMLESAGSLFSMAERLDAAGDESASEMRRFGLGLLAQAAPRMCPLGPGCGLRPAPLGEP